MVLDPFCNVIGWQHKSFSNPSVSPYLPDGVHVNKLGQYWLYRSYRGAMLHACSFPVVFHTFAVNVYSPFLCLLIYSFYFRGASLNRRLSHMVHVLSAISLFFFIHAC